MITTRSAATVCAALGLAAVSAHAQAIIGAVDAATSYSLVNTWGPGNTIDQSGLLATYVPGVTDFDSFFASTAAGGPNSAFLLAHSGGGVGDVQPGGTISYDLGVANTIDTIGLWFAAEPNEYMTALTLFADDDFDFSNGTTATLGSYTNANSGKKAFGFAPVQTRFVHIRMDAYAGGDYLRLNEVGFRQVPAPAAASLLGLGALVATRRRR